MPYPSSVDLELANVALSRISAAPIGAFTDNTLEARTVSRLYPRVRGLMFSSQVDWRFATGRTDLGQPATAIHPWAFEYPLPPNTARVRMVQESTVSADMVDLGPRPFEEGTSVIGGNLVRVVRCDVMPAVLTYTIEIIDPTMWDGGFISCFTMQLAAEISLPITGSGAMAREMAQMSQAAISSQIGPNQTQSVTSVPQGESRTTRGRG